MILELLFDIFFGFMRAVAGLIPDGEAPAWLDDGAGMLAELAGHASGLGAWIPFDLAGTVLTAALSCMAVGFVIRIVRIVASFLTLGGGAT